MKDSNRSGHRKIEKRLVERNLRYRGGRDPKGKAGEGYCCCAIRNRERRKKKREKPNGVMRKRRINL